MSKTFIYIKNIIIPLAVGGIVAFITSKSMDYEMLKQPFLAPPKILFPIVWTILYILMGISYSILENNKLIDRKTNIIYFVQLGINALWSIIFFNLKLRLFAFIWIVILAIAIIIMIVDFCRKNKIAGLIQIPYLLWVLFASYLNISLYLLNK